MVIEAGDEDAVHWLAPNDADEALLQKLSPESKPHHHGGVNAAFLDGSVRFLKATTSKEVRHAWTTIAGGDDAAVKDL
jgi:prepilin-type processing-associated H-X9-DG protein